MTSRDEKLASNKEKKSRTQRPPKTACTMTTVTDRSARLLKSNDLAHFTDFYPRRSRNVRPMGGVNALISVSCRQERTTMSTTTTTTTSRFIASGAEDSFDEEDSGVLVRCANRLVRNHRTARGGATMEKTRVRIMRLRRRFYFR